MEFFSLKSAFIFIIKHLQWPCREDNIVNIYSVCLLVWNHEDFLEFNTVKMWYRWDASCWKKIFKCLFIPLQELFANVTSCLIIYHRLRHFSNTCFIYFSNTCCNFNNVDGTLRNNKHSKITTISFINYFAINVLIITFYLCDLSILVCIWQIIKPWLTEIKQ